MNVAELDAATRTAVEIRASYGLRRDVDWIRTVAADPTATSEFGTPLLPAETSALWARSAHADLIVPIVQGYAAQHVAVFGGVWLDQRAGGVVTASFTDDLEPHRAALAALVAGAGVVHVVGARYSEAALRALQDRISRDSAWFETIPARLTGVGADVVHNIVTVEVSTTNRAIGDLVVTRYDAPRDAVQVESDGTGAALLPWGTVKGRVIAAAGGALNVANLLVDGRGEDPGSCGGGDVGFGVGADGEFDIPCQVGRRTIVVLELRGDQGPVAIGQGSVDVHEGRVARLTIHLDPAP